MTAEDKKEAARQRAREWYKNNRARALERAKEYRTKNRDRVNSAIRSWREANPDRQRVLSSRWAEKNADHKKHLDKVWASKNQTKMRRARKDYWLKNKDKWRIYHQNRRALLRSAEGSLSSNLFDRLMRLQDCSCVYCGCNLMQADIHLDHKTPLSRGGKNCDENMQLTCSVCNLKKHTKTHKEYLANIGLGGEGD